MIIDKASKAIIYYKKKYLLQLRDDDPAICYPNCWSFFGGGIGVCETPWEALQRELQEELHWQPKDGQLLYEWIDNKTNCNNYIFTVPFKGKQQDLILGEGQAMEWFTIDDVMKLTNTPDMVVLMLKKAHKHINNL